MRILIADDQQIVRVGMKDIIEQECDMVVAGEAESGTEVLEKLEKGSFDLVIVDMYMNGIDCVNTVRRLRKEYPHLPILVVSQYLDEELGVRLLRMGASGYLTKECSSTELVKALRTIYTGRKYINDRVAEYLVDGPGGADAREITGQLSNREYQVFRLLVQGKLVDDAARMLSLSKKTIRTYRTRILQKAHLRNDVELANYAHKHNLN